jgi:hypothetical protein
VTFINPTGLAGKVADPAVAVEALLKFNRLMKNCCHALVGLWFAHPRIQIEDMVGTVDWVMPSIFPL